MHGLGRRRRKPLAIAKLASLIKLAALWFSRTMLGIVFVTVSIAHAEEHVPMQFDLECSGRLITSEGGKTTDVPWSNHYRVDRIAGIWCSRGCTMAFDITKPASGPILTLESREDNAGTTLTTVDLESGQFRRLEDSTSFGRSANEAFCSRQPFSGIPQNLY